MWNSILNRYASQCQHVHQSMCRSPNKHKWKTPLSVCVFVEASQCVNKSLGKEKQTNKTELLHKEVDSCYCSLSQQTFLNKHVPVSDLSFFSL